LDLTATRRHFLRLTGLGAVGSFLAACLSQNAPASPAAGGAQSPAAGGGVGTPSTQTITLKMQTAFSPQDIFHEMLTLWARKVDAMTGGRVKVDVLPNNAVVPFTQIIDAVSQGVLDGGLGVPAYWFGKNRGTSLFGTGPSFGMDADMLLGWVHYGGGQALYDELIQQVLRLDVQSYFFGPMPTQPLGWFKNEITSADQIRGLKYRTVGLSADLFNEMGAAVQTLAGGDIVPALQTGRIDAAEFNNPTSDRLLGFQDVSKILMVQSYHQPVECLEILFKKSKYEAMPADIKAIMRFATMAQSADFAWVFMDRNSKDYIDFKQRFNVKVSRTPQPILEAQLKAWDTIIQRETTKPDTGAFFKKVIDSQKEWAKRVVQLRSEIMVGNDLAFKHYFPQ
jgi:TRAP-type mannitol/chloroaromatic compound transport system substrate-binding protein